ncbi:MAG: biotin/lipoyl-containing protein, partial [Nannocystaceae bacterium]
SSALYPKVFDEYKAFRREFSDVSMLSTRAFLAPLTLGEELWVEIEKGKTLIVKLTAVGELDGDGRREVFFELNGQARSLKVLDKNVGHTAVSRERAEPENPGSIGAPMPGAVVEVRCKVGAKIAAGDPLVVLSAMKMETMVNSPVAGTVRRLTVSVGDGLKAGDLLVELEVDPAS